MKFAICNETFGDRSFADTFSTIAKLGYTGVEIAPFTFAPHDEPFDLRKVPAERIVEVRTMAEDAGLEIIGLHWLLAKTEGYYLTSPDPTVRRRTADYLKHAGRSVRRPGRQGAGARLAEAAELAARRFVRRRRRRTPSKCCTRRSPACMQFGVTIGLEPLGPADGDFMLTAEAGNPPHGNGRLALLQAAPRREGDEQRRQSRFPTSSATAANGWSTSTRTTRTCSAPAWATSTSSRSSPR